MMGLPFPAELREFYLTGSGGMDCHWCWNPPEEWAQAVRAIFERDWVSGGPAMISAQRQIEHHNRAAEVLGDWLRYGKPTPQERTIAENLFPLVEIRNGDELFLHVPKSGRGGQVYCYDHEFRPSESPLIEMSDTFEAFLLAWEHLYYVGPEGWMFTPFMEFVDGGYCRINTSLLNVRAWRNLVSAVSAGGSRARAPETEGPDTVC
jgi:hypothetical protein